MAEDFDSHHVPQQSRRDKLRILSHHRHNNNDDDDNPSDLLHYDPFLLPPPPPDLFGFPSSDRLVKVEPSSNLLRFVGDSRHHLYAPSDPQPSSSANPSSIQEDNQAFLCAPHNLGNIGRPGHPSYGSIHSAVGNNARGLSLSLWSRVNSQGSDVGGDEGNLPLPLPLPIPPPLELNLESHGSALASRDRGGSFFGEVMIGPLGPFTGYSSVLGGSRFLKPAQQLLEEICNAGMGIFAAGRVSGSDSCPMEGGGEGFGYADDRCGVGGEKKSRLEPMLDEVSKKFSPCSLCS